MLHASLCYASTTLEKANVKWPNNTEITVRSGKGNKDRLTMLPASVKEPIHKHLVWVRGHYERDLESGYSGVSLPYALERKYPNAAKEWGWQWIFPASSLYIDRQSGLRKKHHLHESVLQKAVKEAVREAGVPKPASPHTMRHYAESRTMPSGSTFPLDMSGLAMAHSA